MRPALNSSTNSQPPCGASSVSISNWLSEHRSGVFPSRLAADELNACCRCHPRGEARRAFLQECRECLLRVVGAHALTELSHFQFDGLFDLVDETLFEEPLAGSQCA